MDRPALLCYDGSDDARAAIATCGPLLGGGAAIVVTVWEPAHADYLGSHLPELGPAVREAVAELDDYATAAAGRRAEEGCELARTAGFEPEPLVLEADGPVWSVIVDAARERDVRVIVTGRRGRSRLAATLLGSVSSGVLSHAHRPVVIVPGEVPPAKP
jgi:nucleotide-binding universal stress UspA family protein